MELTMIIGIIMLGLMLIIIEVVFVPGSTIVGISGMLCCFYGIYKSYVVYGNTWGTVTLVVSTVIGAGALIYSLKGRSWERFSLKKTMDVSFNEKVGVTLKTGDVGKTVSSLKPIGKANFGEEEYEVTSLGGYIEEKQDVRIIRIEGHKVMVELVKKS